MRRLEIRTVKSITLAAMLVAAMAVSRSAQAQLRAFGEAEGFGAVATGARNASSPTIYHVTNLNDSGAGSFRDAVSADNRIVVFDVGGYIHLTSPVSARSNLTILGQTAPGDGIGIYGAEVSFFGRTNDIVRYVRFRDTTLDPGYAGTSSTSSSSSNCLNIGSSSNMIFDHVSCEFAAYNNIDASSAPNLTFQNSIVAAPIASQRFNFHWEGGGSASAGWGAGTFVNNLFIDGHNRSILAKGDTQYVNNTVYNYQAGFTSGNSAGTFRYDVVGNYFVTGPSTTSASNDYYQVNSNQSAYSTGNIRDSNNDGALNGSSSNTVDSANILTTPWSASTSQLPQLGAAASYAWNVAHAGTSLKHDLSTYAVSTGFDAVDAYMVGEVTSLGSGGRLWSSESQTGLSNGGLGTLATGSRPTDSDNDGIPDAWESAHGMNPNNAADALALNPLGYRMIEQYANELGATNDTRTWSASGGGWSTAANWSGSVTPGALDYASILGSGSSNGGVTLSSGTANAMSVSIGGNGPAAGEKLTVAGGTLNVYDTIKVGDQNNASIELNSGSVQAYNVVLGNTVYSPSATNYTGTIFLHGGTLALSQLVLGGGAPDNWNTGGTLDWSGGTLKAIAQLKVNVPITVSGTAATLDTAGFDGTISGAILGSGNLAKIGSGTLTLTGANNYTGTITVSAGKLLNNGTGNSGSASIQSGASLGGAGTFSGIVVDSGGILAPGNSIGTLKVLQDAAVHGTLQVELNGAAGGSADLLTVAGTLDLTGASVIFSTVSGGSAPNDAAYIFATYGTLVGTFGTNISGLPTGYSINYAYNNGTSNHNIAIVAVPEPSSMSLTITAAITAAIGGLGCRIQRRASR
jgi:autotransporter-associated beta strand protein